MDCCDASILVTVSSKLQHCSLRQCSPSVKTLFTCSRTGRRVGQRRNYLFDSSTQLDRCPPSKACMECARGVEPRELGAATSAGVQFF
ncbi:hypothetical protein VPH35_006622 [Triticum aestivum]